MKANQIIGLNIRKHREIAGLKQDTLAKMVGIEPSALSQIENGKTDTSVNRLQQIAQALGVDFVFLVSHPHYIHIQGSVNSGNLSKNSGLMNNEVYLTKNIVVAMEKMVELMDRLSKRI